MLLNPKFTQQRRATTGYATLDQSYVGGGRGLGPTHPTNSEKKRNEHRSMTAMNFHPKKSSMMPNRDMYSAENVAFMQAA